MHSMGVKLTFLGCDFSGAVVSTPGPARAAGHGDTAPHPRRSPGQAHRPQQPPSTSQPSLRPSLLSLGLQMGFYCILFCNGSRDGPRQGSGRSCPPQRRQDGPSRAGAWGQLCPLP